MRRKYRIINCSGKAYRPQWKSFLFWHNFLEFKGLYDEEVIYNNFEDAKKRIEEDIRDGKLEDELKASRKYRINDRRIL